MNKKIIFTLSAISLSFTAQANWYAGVNLGINDVNLEKNLTYPLDEPQPTSSNFYNTYTNFHGQLTAGYEFILLNQIGIALEGNADFYAGKSNYTINNWFFSEDVRATEKLRYGFGLFILPEYQINPFMRLFVGPGIETSEFAINFNNTAGNVGVSKKDKQWLTGWALKVGTEGHICKNTDLVLTYQFTQYENLTLNQIEPLSGDYLRGRYKPNVNLFMIGLKFNLPDRTVNYVTK
ncbi:outer membrane beta-barrel protein [Legionella sp. CNM-1927-20]|uniref:outer membrane beta-barrel protein n=1 Tax=Legionella sp. CNM-1927-20 TaxID=3422221 RepID=UPI00403AEB03